MLRTHQKKWGGGVRTSSSLRSSLLVGLILFASACKDDPSEPPVLEPSETAVPEFSAQDVNPTSPRTGENVSPRDYLGSVSAWYFGHST